MTNKPLTRRQAEALEFIKAFLAKNGYPPTVREIAEHMGYHSSSTAFQLLEQLVRKGFVTKGGRTAHAPGCLRQRSVSWMRQLTYNECMALLDSIRSSVPGSWTHDLQVIAIGPVRFVDRVQIPSGHEVVYFRMPDGAGAWPGANWDRFAVVRAPRQVEQMTLF